MGGWFVDICRRYVWRFVYAMVSVLALTGSVSAWGAPATEDLPDGRNYEMVTPPQKNAALVGAVFTGIVPSISEDGRRVIASSIQCFANAESCIGSRQKDGSQYLFSRTPGGWETVPFAPSATQFIANSSWLASADSGMELFSMPTPPAFEDDFYVRRPDGSFIDIGAATPPASGPEGEPWGANSIAATSDFSHVVFQEPALWSFVTPGAEEVLYELSTQNKTPTLVGVNGGDGSTDLISECGAESGAHPGALSAGGEVIYFKAFACEAGRNGGVEVPANTLYARIGHSKTVKISERSPTNCTTVTCQTSSPQNASFVGASSDGTKAYFISDQQLTDNASVEGNLYEYDFDNRAGENLIDVSAGLEEAGVQGVLAMSPDGSHVYFVARGILTSAANHRDETAVNGANNLYLFERDASHPEGHLMFIADLSASDANEQWMSGNHAPFVANVSPDGRFLVFEDRERLTADDTRSDGAKQIFRYDAETGELLRISVGDRGFDANGNGGSGDARIVPAYEGARRAGPAHLNPTMSNDGRYIFFESPVALTAHAVGDVQIGTFNEEPVYAENVYEWHEGHIGLISDGRDTTKFASESAVKLIGTDATGADVFFRTADALLPQQDIDTQMDYYDARTCTSSEPCSPLPEAPRPLCAEEATCRGMPVGAPSEPSGGSAMLNGTAAGPGFSKHARVGHKHTKARKKKARCFKTRKHTRANKRTHKCGRAGK